MMFEYKECAELLNSEEDLYKGVIELAEEEYQDDKDALNYLLDIYSLETGYSGSTVNVETFEDFQSEMRIIGGFEFWEVSEDA